MAVRIEHLTSCRLPPGHPAQRNLPRGSGDWSAENRERYDRRTFFYDAIPSDGRLTLVCPSLKPRLRRWLKGLAFRVDGSEHPIDPQRLTNRTDLIHLPAPSAGPRELRLSIRDGEGGAVFDARVPPPDVRLRGRRALVTLSRNNRLEWIADWVRYHVEVQGADALVLFDNGSTDYDPEDIAAALDDIAGLGEAAIVPAPLPFGPVGNDRVTTTARFLQFSLLYIAKVRFLAEARGVLNCDIDELV
ncbi:MAG: hypothetical protein ACPGID_09985, partial [Rubricella sp.]